MKAGDGLEVAMGGGREMFLPETMDDPEDAGKKGARKDGKDLTKAWTDRYGNSGAYVWNEEQFAALDPANVDHVLGLFERSHMEYEFDREKDAGREPSIAEMTVKAIDDPGRRTRKASSCWSRAAASTMPATPATPTARSPTRWR